MHGCTNGTFVGATCDPASAQRVEHCAVSPSMTLRFGSAAYRLERA